jgi:hypothetical protein
MKNPKINDMFIGTFNYYATGEGWHMYVRLCRGNTKTEIKEKIIDIMKKRWGGSDEFLSTAIDVTRIDEVDYDQYPLNIQSVLRNAVDFASKGAMVDGDFELYFSYNFS